MLKVSQLIILTFLAISVCNSFSLKSKDFDEEVDATCWFNPGCPKTEEFFKLCEEAGGFLCGPNFWGNVECCVDGSQCLPKSITIFGWGKKWRQCEKKINIDCP